MEFSVWVWGAGCEGSGLRLLGYRVQVGESPQPERQEFALKKQSLHGLGARSRHGTEA